MLKKDSFVFGVILGIVSILISAAIIYIVLVLLKVPVVETNLRFFSLSFVPCMFLMRYYFRKLYFLKTGKALITVLFVLMLVFFVYLFRSGILTFS